MTRVRIPHVASAIALALVACAFSSHARAAQPAPAATPTPIPTPSPAALPYPAYGTPAPGVASTVPAPGVPQRVTLDQAIAIAALKSPALVAARSQFAIAQAEVNGVKSAVFPEFDGNAGYTSTTGGNGVRGSGSANGSSSSAGNNFISRSAGLSLQQLIFDGGKVIAQIHQAKNLELAAGDTYERELETLSFNVAQAYYSALQAHAATLLAAQQVKQDEVGEDLVRAQIRAGTEPRVSLATAQLPTAQARVALVRDQGAELAADAAFANVLGLDADTDVLPANNAQSSAAATLLRAPIPSYRKAVDRALALRPDYLAAVYEVTAAQENVQAQKLSRMPTITGSASLGTASTEINGSGYRGSSTVGAQLTFPIYDRGLTNFNVAQAAAQLDSARANALSTKLGVQLGVRQALTGLISAQAALTQAQAELNEATQVLHSTQAQYRAGVTTLPLLLNAQVGLATAQTDRLTAVYALRQAEQSYLFQLGESDLGT